MISAASPEANPYNSSATSTASRLLGSADSSNGSLGEDAASGGAVLAFGYHLSSCHQAISTPSAHPLRRACPSQPTASLTDSAKTATHFSLLGTFCFEHESNPVQ